MSNIGKTKYAFEKRPPIENAPRDEVFEKKVEDRKKQLLQDIENAEKHLDGLKKKACQQETIIGQLEGRRETIEKDNMELSAQLREAIAQRDAAKEAYTTFCEDLETKREEWATIEASLEKRVAAIDEKDKHHKKWELGLSYKETALNEREARIANKEEELKRDDERVKSNAMALHERQKVLTGEEEEVKRKTKELNEREGTLVIAIKATDELKASLENEYGIISKEKNDAMDAREKAVEEREKEVEKKENSIAERDKEYVIRNEELTVKERLLRVREKKAGIPEEGV